MFFKTKKLKKNEKKNKKKDVWIRVSSLAFIFSWGWFNFVFDLESNETVSCQKVVLWAVFSTAFVASRPPAQFAGKNSGPS